jgi:hypothetical protein
MSAFILLQGETENYTARKLAGSACSSCGKRSLQTRHGEVKRVASLGVDFGRRREREEVQHLG